MVPDKQYTTASNLGVTCIIVDVCCFYVYLDYIVNVKYLINRLTPSYRPPCQLIQVLKMCR